MARCANGHDSGTDDYCDVCGVPIGGAGSAASAGASAGPSAARPSAAGPSAGAPSAGSGPAGGGQVCGNCGQPMLAGARFCEQCGWDAEAATLGGDPTPPPEPAPPPPGPAAPGAVAGAPPLAGPPAAAGSVPPPGSWLLVATANREYFDTVLEMEGEDAGSLTFPVYWPERRFVLTGDRILIGRASRSRGSAPEVDLGGQFTDPGVSHLHAVLVVDPAGGWTVADLGSSNGTYVNDQPDPLEPHVPVPVREQDRIHLGAWTTLTLIRS